MGIWSYASFVVSTKVFGVLETEQVIVERSHNSL